MKYVLDASALLSGLELPEGEFLAPPGVVREVRSRGLTPQLEAVLENKVLIREPAPEDSIRVERAARDTGDESRLSPVDKDLVALALTTGGTLVTDDYSVQNVAQVLGVPYRGFAQEEIRRVIRWRYRCGSCRLPFERPAEACPVCGGPIRSWPARKAAVRDSSPDTGLG